MFSKVLSTAASMFALTSAAKSFMGNHRDSSTYANTEDAVTTHISLNFGVDFDRKVFDGHVVLDMLTLKDDISNVFLDTVGMQVHRTEFQTIHEGCNIWRDVDSEVTEPNHNIGKALNISIPIKMPNSTGFQLRVTYTTNDETTAISWMTKEQTAGKKLPYLYTQCEDIACRSVAPLQDTPSVKATYDATVTVKKEFNVKMSANETGVKDYNSTHKQFSFRNDIRMPSYLIAIAVGDLEYRSLGERVGVITEPSRMDAVAWELEALPNLLDRAEQYLTPYIWGNYSILVLPPSFPMGGMENPLLTFASPTIITGDKSQVDVATHEIAHSWTGNDVTCENWSNMWLNEGFTVFEERKVSASIHGKDFALVAAYLGNISMYGDMVGYGLNNSYASLYPVIGDGYPDESFSEIPYEKGFQLLYYLETLLGETKMQQLLRSHIDMNAQHSINYTNFQVHFIHFVQDNFDKATAADIISKMDWEAWVRRPGLAPVHLDFTTKALNESGELAEKYIELKGAESPNNFKDYVDNFYSNLRVVFHERLNQRFDEVTLDIMSKIDSDLNVTSTLDPEIKQRWYPLGLKKGYKPATEAAHAFISAQGRMKYLQPIYQALLDSNQRDLAVEWFNENKNFYHPYSVKKLAKLLNIKEKEEEELFLTA